MACNKNKVVEGVLKCKQISMQKSEYEWVISDFEARTSGSAVRTSPLFCPIPKVSAQFNFQIETEKSCKHIEGSYFMTRFVGSLSLFLVDSTSDLFKFSIETSFLNEQGHTLEKGKESEQSLSRHDIIHCLKFKKTGLMTTKTNNSLLQLPNNVLVVKCHLNILNIELLQRISENLSIDCSTYLKDLSNDLKEIYSNTTLSDFSIHMGAKEFKVHRAILAARSPVFRTMLYHDCIKSKTSLITLSDHDSTEFELFLMYLYTGVLESNDLDCVLTIYKLADMYDVKSLQRTCVDIIVDKFVWKGTESIGDLFKILKMAFDLSCEKLKTLVAKCIVNNFLLIAQQPEWRDFVISDPQIASEVLVNVASTYKDILNKHLNCKSFNETF